MTAAPIRPAAKEYAIQLRLGVTAEYPLAYRSVSRCPAAMRHAYCYARSRE